MARFVPAYKIIWRWRQNFTINVKVTGYDLATATVRFVVERADGKRFEVSSADDITVDPDKGEISAHLNADTAGISDIAFGDLEVGKHSYYLDFLDAKGHSDFNVQGEFETVPKIGPTHGPRPITSDGSIVLSSEGGFTATLQVVGQWDEARIVSIETKNTQQDQRLDALESLPPGGGAVESVFGRTGAVTAIPGDYAAYYEPLWAGNTYGWLMDRTIEHTATQVLVLTKEQHNRAEIHLKSTGDMLLVNTACDDAFTCRIINDTAAGRILYLSSFEAAYIRDGGPIADAGDEIGLPVNTSILISVTVTDGKYFLNIHKGIGGALIASIDGNRSRISNLETQLSALQSQINTHEGKADIHYLDVAADGTLYGRKDAKWEAIKDIVQTTLGTWAFAGIGTGIAVASGTFRTNGNDITQVTSIRIHPFNGDAVDSEILLKAHQAGDELFFQAINNSTVNGLFTINTNPIMAGVDVLFDDLTYTDGDGGVFAGPFLLIGLRKV